MKEKEKGLGDTVFNFLDRLSIHALVKSFKMTDCGCEKRQETLNKLFPYTKPKK